jgi:hypothetical protein
MIIKLIPENQAEKDNVFKGEESITHNGVKNYFIMGLKNDEDGTAKDFHEWSGSYRYLVANLGYFYEIINDERRGVRQSKPQRETEQMPQFPQFPLFKRADMTDIAPIKMGDTQVPVKMGSVCLNQKEVVPDNMAAGFTPSFDLTVDEIDKMAKNQNPSGLMANGPTIEEWDLPREENIPEEMEAEDHPAKTQTQKSPKIQFPK